VPAAAKAVRDVSLFLASLLFAGSLPGLFASCAPAVGPTTLAAIVSYESDTQPWAIGDNTAHRSYVLDSRAAAESRAGELLAAGHNLDLGLMQINTVHLGQNGLRLANVFDPCTNVTAGSSILRGAYHAAVRRFGPGQDALTHALSAYNTGSLFAGGAYAAGVRARAAALQRLTSSASFAGESVTIRTRPVAERAGLAPATVLGRIGDGERSRPQ
jgi:type IV secretion system protein VirB1